MFVLTFLLFVCDINIGTTVCGNIIILIFLIMCYLNAG